MEDIMNRPLFYRLDEQGNPVPEPDTLTWARWHEASRLACRVAWTFYGGAAHGQDYDIHISTVFLGQDHNFLGDGPAILWETMVFAEQDMINRLRELSEADDRSIFARAFGGIDIQRRYASRAAAAEGHTNLCQLVEACIAQGLIQIRS